MYYLASVTKSFTATTLLSVLEDLGPESGITLKTKIASIIPDDFVLPDEYATQHATLEDALGHNLGVAAANVCYGGDGYTVRDAVRCLRHLTMKYELRQQQEYLNLGYMTIQHVIETLTGKPIEELHRRYIWRPLGMSSTFPKLADAEAAKNTLATGHNWDPVEKHLQETAYAQDYPLIGGGGLIVSIKDLTAYLRAVVNGTLPLGKDSQRELFTPRSISGDTDDPNVSTGLYALGWGVSHRRGNRFISHSGGIDGFSSRLAFMPDHKWGVAMLVNEGLNGSAVIECIQNRLVDDLLDIPNGERTEPVAKWDKWLNERKDGYINTRKTLYPDLPKPPLPLPVPLVGYEGAYHHPGYRTIELKVADAPKHFPIDEDVANVLHAELDRLLHMTLDLEHVSGDFFIAWRGTLKPNFANKGGAKARFVLRGDGAVDKLGIDIEADGQLVWFDKVTED